MDTALDVIFIFLSTILLSVAGIKMLHMYQLSSYRFKGVLSWLKASHYDYILRYFTYSLLTVCFMLLFRYCFPWEWESGVHYFSYIAYVVFGIAFAAVAYAKKSKVPLAVTPRMRRLILTYVVVCLAFSVGGWALSLTPMYECGYAILPVLVPLMAAIAYFVVEADFAAWPFYYMGDTPARYKLLFKCFRHTFQFLTREFNSSR